MKRPLNRRSLMALATAAGATAALAGPARAPAFAQGTYPDKPITMVVPARRAAAPISSRASIRTCWARSWACR